MSWFSPCRVHEVVAADAVVVAVAARRDDGQLQVGELRCTRDREFTAVDGVEAVAVEVAVELPRTADAGEQRHLVGVLSDFGHGLFQRLQDAEVATARTPRRLRFDTGRELVSFGLSFVADC